MADSTNDSSIKSYVDSATGAVQSAIGSVTGSASDQTVGEAKKDQAAAEKQESHTIGKLGPVNVSSAGGVSTDDPRRTQGQYDQFIGSSKEALGGLVGSSDLKNAGAEQNAQGKATEAEGQLADIGHGMKDRVHGAAGGVGAALTGDREAQQKYQQMHDDAKTQLRSAQGDIQKQAESEAKARQGGGEL